MADCWARATLFAKERCQALLLLSTFACSIFALVSSSARTPLQLDQMQYVLLLRSGNAADVNLRSFCFTSLLGWDIGFCPIIHQAIHHCIVLQRNISALDSVTSSPPRRMSTFTSSCAAVGDFRMLLLGPTYELTNMDSITRVRSIILTYRITTLLFALGCVYSHNPWASSSSSPSATCWHAAIELV
jgi:hypothetical protein